ncbi:MAG: serine hydrolase [Anaerolineae bacterium]|nr:serine hydrolase [Anaerolineae bacterium]
MRGYKFAAFALIILIILYLLYQLQSYITYRNLLPPGTVIAGLDVGLLSEQEAQALIDQAFGSPVALHYGSDTFKLTPRRVEFHLTQTTVWAELSRQRAQTSFLEGFGLYLLGEPPKPLNVDVEARYNEQKLIQFLNEIARQQDRGMLEPQINHETLTYSPGAAARWLDIEASLLLVEAALNSASERQVDLIVQEGTTPPGADVSLLKEMIDWRLSEWPGIVGVFAKSMVTGEEVVINGDVAYAGMSILKIPILIETYRYLDHEPGEETAKLLRETMIQSGNFTANLLLRQIGYVQAGNDSAFAGVDVLNAALKKLGFVNTFMATPYDTDELPRIFSTPANSRTDLTTRPDPYMQTTPFETGLFLEMIYQLGQGGGTLMAAHPGSFTAEEGQVMIGLMAQNHEAILLEGGLPEGVTIAHKHGYVADTHADAAIVLVPEGNDFVLVVFIYANTEWLGDRSLPLFRDIATATYNYYNIDRQYVREDLNPAE